MVLQLPGGKKGEAQLKRMLKPVKDRAINEDLPDAADVIAKIEKDIAGLKKRVKALESTSKKLWADKVERDIDVTKSPL
jgi:hypothetical protein